MANPITIKIDQVTLAAGVAGSSRDDGVVSQVVTLSDPANAGPMAGRLWQLVNPEGAVVAISSGTAELPTFTPPVQEGTYLVYLSYGDGTKSWTVNANGERVSTQGGFGIKQVNGNRLIGTGETNQFGVRGWAPSTDEILRPIDGQLPIVTEKEALAGTVGVPSNTNRYVTDQDTRLAGFTHTVGGPSHSADTIANFNTKIVDANLDDENSLRPADQIQTTSGPTLLTVGAILDGDILARSGATVVGRSAISSQMLQSSFGVAQGASTQEATLGRVTFTGDLIGVSIHMESARTAGTVTVNVKVNGVTKLTSVINGASTEENSATVNLGVYPVTTPNEISVEVIGDAAYTNAAGGPVVAVVNVTLTDNVGATGDPNVAVLGAAQTFTKAQTVKAVDLGNIAGNAAIDATLSNTFKGVATAAVQIDNPTGLVDGQTLVFRITQGGVGSFAVTFGANFDFGDDGAPTTAADAPGTLLIVTGVSDGTKVFSGSKKGYTA